MTVNAISRIRRFNRTVALELGALDASYLGRNRSLGAARALCGVPEGGIDVAALRADLALDKGQLSRVLKGLEDEGLITLATDKADARRRSVHRTDKGRAEIAAYDALSDERAERMLQSSPQSNALLAAMDLIATTLGQERITIAQENPRSPAARQCLEAYYAELARRLSMGFDVTLSRDPEAAAMEPPAGAFFLAWSDGLPIGCVGLKGPGPVAEVKRLWVADAARRLGLAKRLMAALEKAAPSLGIHTLRLDTNTALPEAEALYRRTGWTQIDRFNDDPYPDLFFEKHLEPSPPSSRP